MKLKADCSVCSVSCAAYTGPPYEAVSRDTVTKNVRSSNPPPRRPHTQPLLRPRRRRRPSPLVPRPPSALRTFPAPPSEGERERGGVSVTYTQRHTYSTSTAPPQPPTTPYSPPQPPTNESLPSLPSLLFLTWRSALFGFATFAAISPSS